MTPLLRILSCGQLLLASLLFWLAASVSAATAPAMLVLAPASDEHIALGRWLDILIESDSPLTAGELAAADAAGTLRWQRLQHETLSLGFHDQPLWLRLEINNPGPASEQVLQLPRATLGHTGIYSRDSRGQWQWQERGVDTVARSGGLPLPGSGFLLNIPHGHSRHYLQLASDHAIMTSVQLGSLAATLYAAQNGAGWFGWCLGALGGLLLGLLLRPPQHVNRSLLLSLIALQLAAIVYALADRGVLGNWWLNVPGAQYGMLQVSNVLLQVALCWYTLCQLQHQHNLSLSQSRWLVGWLGLLAAMLMLGLVISQADGVRLLLGLPALTAGLLVSQTWLACRRQPGSTRQVLLLVLTTLLLVHLLLLAMITGLLVLPWEPYQLLLAWHMLTAPVLIWLAAQPVAEPAREPALGRVARMAPMQAPRILVVEDNVWVSEVISGLLRKLGLEVDEVADGHQALAWLAREHCDLVLMDCDLPGLDGLSATQVWRRREQMEGRLPLPIIAVTAHVSGAQRQQALDAGMNDFLAKPVDMRKLRETVVRWLGSDALQGSARALRDNT